jgi:hypothetical protein
MMNEPSGTSANALNQKNKIYERIEHGAYAGRV